MASDFHVCESELCEFVGLLSIESVSLLPVSLLCVILLSLSQRDCEPVSQRVHFL